jgi:hypothetical protein
MFDQVESQSDLNLDDSNIDLSRNFDSLSGEDIVGVQNNKVLNT